MKKQYITDIIEKIVGDKVKAEMVVERLTDEGVLNLGYGSADINLVLTTFQETFGTTKHSKYDRFAANRLCMKYGAQGVAGIIKLLGASSDEKFAPVVNTVTELETKLPSVLNFLRKANSQEEIIGS